MGTRHISPSPRGGEGDDARLTPLKYASIVVSPVYPSRRTGGSRQRRRIPPPARGLGGTPINDACIQRVNWTKIDEIRGVASKIIKWEGCRTPTSDVMRGWCPFRKPPHPEEVHSAERENSIVCLFLFHVCLLAGYVCSYP